jgi:periplasmic protein TonB
MFERLPSSQVVHFDHRGTALTAFSISLHVTVAGALLVSSYLALPPISLPRLRPVLVTPIFFHPPVAGPRAPARGSRSGSSPGRATAVHPATGPQLQPPREELPPPEPAKPEEARADFPADPDSGAVAGSPDGAPDGDPEGLAGGACIGDDCDPDGPPGAGPGIKGLPGGRDLPAIQRPGILDVTEPVLIESSRIIPIYPELARRAGLPGRVILEAVVQPDGTVASVVVLRETPPRLGFGEAAEKAVSQWRYRPALQRGIPVAVYFTVVVQFELSR